jgi:class 3 adenylate cyclase/sensor domain CHASE-containing protein
VWDATYDFIATGDPAYIEENYADLTLYHNRLSFIAIVDGERKVRFAKAVDLVARAPALPPGELDPPSGPIAGLLRGPGEDTPIAGTVLMRGGPLLVAAHPIVRSNGAGPARGTVLMGRWLDTHESKRLGEMARLELEVHRLDTEALAPDVAAARSRVTAWNRTSTAPVDDETLAGYGLVTGLDGAPVLMLRVPIVRDIWAEGQKATLYLMLAVVVIGIAFAVLLVIALERLVLSRLSTLDREVGEIGARGDLARRIPPLGDDEIGRLGARINEMVAAVERLNRELVVEQQQSERLLLNVLPRQVARRLKQEGGTIADGFDEVSVLFADLVDFTKLSTRVSAGDLVGMLDAIFTRFDELADRHGLEKIKTIGDAYMVVSGLPERRPDHARAAARMALDMRSALFDFNAEHGTSLNLRIGVHCGPVVAGVIGRRKFIYDIWGDTVNTASRMESHGASGGIQVSADFRDRVADEFDFEARRTIQVKGKGEMAVYFLTGRRAAEPA